MNKRRAFTLIEILVVMTIIAVLVGLLVCVVSMVRRAGANVVCQNQLRSIGLAVVGYAADNQGRTQPYFSWRADGSYWVWAQYITEQLAVGDQASPSGRETAAWKTFHCPEQRSINRTSIGSGSMWTDNISYGISNLAFGLEMVKGQKFGDFDYNNLANPLFKKFLIDQQKGVKLGAIGRASETFFCADSERSTPATRWRIQYDQEMGFRHPNNKANALMADWHVKGFTRPETVRTWCGAWGNSSAASCTHVDGMINCGVHGTPWNFNLQ